eukprot:9430718-Karenia_brevis.AAC.1
MYGLTIKTRRTSSSGKEICKMWNDNRGCHNSSCPHLHICDAMLPNGRACESKDHNRAGHTGPSVSI